MKLFWMIVAGVAIVVAAYFLFRRDFDTAFIVATVGALAWFLNYRAQMREITAKADIEEDKEHEEDVNDDSDAE